jgi:hypothetical protein
VTNYESAMDAFLRKFAVAVSDVLAEQFGECCACDAECVSLWTRLCVFGEGAGDAGASDIFPIAQRVAAARRFANDVRRAGSRATQN